MISAAQVRGALVLLGWTPSKLAAAMLVTFDKIDAALDDTGIRCLGGLQTGLVQDAFERAGVDFISENSEIGARLRGSKP